MAIVFCTKWDSTLNATTDPCGSDDLVPTYTEGSPYIDTANPKFGAGCLGGNAGTDYLIYWEGLSNLPSNEGALGVWLRSKVVNDFYADFYIGYNDPGSTILLSSSITVALGLRVTLQMYDSSNVIRVDDSNNSAHARDTNWHYLELNWLWNDASGKSEIFFDGVSKLSNTGGNSYSRDGTQTDYVDAYGQYSYMVMDDYTLWDARQHTSGFSNPTSAQCACAAAALKRPLTLGAPFGGMSNLGR